MELMKLEWSRTCEQGERLMSKEPLASSTRPVDQPVDLVGLLEVMLEMLLAISGDEGWVHLLPDLHLQLRECLNACPDKIF